MFHDAIGKASAVCQSSAISFCYLPAPLTRAAVVVCWNTTSQVPPTSVLWMHSSDGCRSNVGFMLRQDSSTPLVVCSNHLSIEGNTRDTTSNSTCLGAELGFQKGMITQL